MKVITQEWDAFLLVFFIGIVLGYALHWALTGTDETNENLEVERDVLAYENQKLTVRNRNLVERLEKLLKLET